MLQFTKKELDYSLGLLKLLRKGPDLGLDFPALIELQTVNRCNAQCQACPYRIISKGTALQVVDDRMFEDFLGQLAKEKNFQILVLGFQNEPFIDPKLVEKARRFKELMPNKVVEIVTNGNLLNAKNIPEIFKYFDRVSISVNAHSKEVYEKVMEGLSWEKLMDNIEIIAQKKEWVDKTIVRFIRQTDNAKEYQVFKKYWNKRGFMVFRFDINSRLNAVGNYESLKIKEDAPRKLRLGMLKLLSNALVKTCAIPFISFYIRANGDVVLCFNDYSENNILGNIKKNSIREIFNSAAYQKIRKQALEGNITDNPVCSQCDLYKSGIWLTTV